MKAFILILLILASVGCGRHSEPAGPYRHYALSGKVVSLDRQHRTATIDAAAIPNYMEAMTMEYPVKSTGDFVNLHVGQQITATLDVAADDSYVLSNVKPGSGSTGN